MAKSSSVKHIVMSIPLPEHFIEDIKEVMNDELEIAQRKWSVQLSDEQKETVLEYSLLQLRAHVAQALQYEWNPAADNLLVYVQTDGKADEYAQIERFIEENPEAEVVFGKVGWLLIDEPSTSNVKIADFAVHLISWIRESARWAVFYGVGSYDD